MKRSIPVLIVIGIAAALSAAILVASLRTGPTEADAVATETPRDVKILVATRDIEAMSVLEADAVRTETVTSDRVPQGYLTHGVEVVGKVVAVPVEEGQAFTKALFITEGTGVHLASMLAEGMRAMSVSLTNYSGLEGLLYPGAAVDVLATFGRSRGQDGSKEPVSISLMRGVLVLAIEDRTIVSENLDKTGLDKLKRERRRAVTLMVTPKQAELLQLAMEHGIVSLSLRNPTDAARAEQGFTSMTELLGNKQVSPDRPHSFAGLWPASAWSDTPPTEAADNPIAPPQMWEVTVLRAGEAEVHQFTLPGETVSRTVGH